MLSVANRPLALSVLRRRLRRGWQGVRVCLAVAAGMALLAPGATPLEGSTPSPTEASPPTVVRLTLDTIIHPVAAQFVERALEEAAATRAEAVVIEIDTPGGLLTSTRQIFTAMLGSETPVVVYVSPSGAQAASAGFFLLMAADVAAMAPGTNTGAAHPVGGGGEEITGTMAEKVEQDAAATIRSLAARNGRNAEMAEAAVVESRSFTADEALEAGLVDLIAAGLPQLLTEIDGREVMLEGGERRALATAAAAVVTIEMGPFQRVLSALAHPNIAYLLLTLGGLGLYFELSNPGAVLPGVIGGICLLLAFFALSVLPVNYAGIGLIVLALLFFIAEVKITSYGLLTVAGVASLVLGSMMLFDSPDPAIRVSLDVIVGVALVSLVVVGFLLTMVVRVHRTQVKTGAEGLIHERGVTRGTLSPRGKVFVHGEIWDAVADAVVEGGRPIEVVAVEGMLLRVRPAPPAAGGSQAADDASSMHGGTT